MNSKERILTTFKHEEPDRVPISDQQIDNKVASEILGRSVGSISEQFELLRMGERDLLVGQYIENMLELYQKLDLDFIVAHDVHSKKVDLKSLPKKIAPNIYRFEDKETGVFCIQRFDESSQMYATIDSTYIREDTDALEKWINVMRKALEKDIVFDETTLEGLEGIVNGLKGERAIGFPAGIGIWTIPFWLEATILKSEWVEVLLDYQLQLAIAKIKNGAKRGVDFFLSEIDIADNKGPIYNPAIFRKIIFYTGNYLMLK